MSFLKYCHLALNVRDLDAHSKFVKHWAYRGPCIGFAVCGWVQIFLRGQWLTNFLFAGNGCASACAFYQQIFTSIGLKWHQFYCCGWLYKSKNWSKKWGHWNTNQIQIYFVIKQIVLLCWQETCLFIINWLSYK